MYRFLLVTTVMCLLLLGIGSSAPLHAAQSYPLLSAANTAPPTAAIMPAECVADESRLYLPLTMIAGATRSDTTASITSQAVLTEANELPASIGVVTVSGVAPLEFNPGENTITFALDCTTFAEDSSSFSVMVNGDLYPSDYLTATDTTVTFTHVGYEDGNRVVLVAEDIEGKAVTAETFYWAGFNTLSVTVYDPNGEIAEGAEVTLELGDDKRVQATATTDANGHVVFENVPNRTVFLTARSAGNLFVAESVMGGISATTLRLLGFNPASPIDNNDFSLGTEGWDIGTAPVEIIPHAEDGHRVQGDMDLRLTTAGPGPQSISRTFDVDPGTEAVRVRYRFITTEIPGGYYGTQYNDSFNVTVRVTGNNGATWESNSMNGLGIGAFDASGATDWREQVFTFPPEVLLDGGTVQVNVSVANVADGKLDSSVVVDAVKESKLEINADKTTLCPNETVVFTPINPVEGEIAWSGGGTPATGTGNSFETRFATAGDHTVTATLETKTATATVHLNELSGASWHSQFPGSTSTTDLSAGFSSNADNFIGALRTAGATVSIAATLRPPERAYLMHYSYKIANEDIAPEDVPAKAGVNICWVHRDTNGDPDLAASRAAAQAMVTAYGIAYAPALQSRHTEGNAVDMTISWTGTLTLTNASGEVVAITTEPRTGAGNTELHAVGATYGAKKLVGDPPHWSSDGH